MLRGESAPRAPEGASERSSFLRLAVLKNLTLTKALLNRETLLAFIVLRAAFYTLPNDSSFRKLVHANPFT